MPKDVSPSLTPTQKLARVVRLVNELQDETNEAIVEARMAGLAKELQVNPYQCALVYWAKKLSPEFKRTFGADVRVSVRATKARK